MGSLGILGAVLVKTLVVGRGVVVVVVVVVVLVVVEVVEGTCKTISALIFRNIQHN